MTPGTHCHPMIFSSGQAGGQLQLICKPCPQTTPVRPGNYHWEISSPCQIIVKFVFWNLRTVGCGMWYQIYWQDRQWRSIIIFQIQHISSDSCYSIKHKELASAFDYWGGTEARTTQSHQKTFRLQTWHDIRENGGCVSRTITTIHIQSLPRWNGQIQTHFLLLPIAPIAFKSACNDSGQVCWLL